MRLDDVLTEGEREREGFIQIRKVFWFTRKLIDINSGQSKFDPF